MTLKPATIASTDHGGGNRRCFISLLLCTLTLAARLLPTVQHKGPQWAPSQEEGFPVSINFSQSGSSESETRPEAREARDPRNGHWVLSKGFEPEYRR